MVGSVHPGTMVGSVHPGTMVDIRPATMVGIRPATMVGMYLLQPWWVCTSPACRVHLSSMPGTPLQHAGLSTLMSGMWAPLGELGGFLLLTTRSGA